MSEHAARPAPPARDNDAPNVAPSPTADAPRSRGFLADATAIPPAGAPIQKRSKIDKKTVEDTMKELASNCPAAVAPYVEKATPVVVAVINGIDMAYPYCVKVYAGGEAAWKFIEPYGPEQYFGLLFGFFLLFFGGAYFMLVAAIEALRITGVYDKLYKSYTTFYVNYQRASEAQAKDDLLDENNDGVLDHLQRTEKENLSRKIYIFAKSVAPDEVSDAAIMGWNAILAIISTVRVHAARCLTFGIAMGETLYTPLRPTVEPAIKKALPDDLSKWAPTVTRHIFSVGGIFFAYMMQRVITGFHTATRGAMLTVAALLRICEKRGITVPLKEGDKVTVMACWALAAIGFYFQWSNGFSAPFPFNVMLLPFTLCEWFLNFAVAVGLDMTSDAAPAA